MDVQLGDVSGIDLTAALVRPAPAAAGGGADRLFRCRDGDRRRPGRRRGLRVQGRARRAHRDRGPDAALGGTWFPAGLLSTLLAGAESPLTEPLGQLFAQLTDREREVLQLLVCGLDRKAISARLNRSSDTVKTHIRNIAAKLGTRSTAEAVAVALSAGLRPG